MKKSLLLVMAVFFGFNVFAQNTTPGWEVYHSGYTDESRGISSIAILNDTSSNVAWSIAYDGSSNGDQISEVAYSNDGGYTWTAYNLANNVLPGIINPGIGTVLPVDENTAFIAAYKTNIGNGGIWKTTDAGATWTKVSSNSMYANSNSFCNLVYFFDDNNGFCQGDPINGEFEMYYTTDGGNTWTPISGSDIDDPQTGEYGYVHGYVVAGNTIWFTTSKGRLYRSTDQGLTWIAHDTPLNDFGGNNNDSGDVTFKDDNEGWLVRNNGELYHTTDAGDTWTAITPTYDWAGSDPNNPNPFFGGDIAYIPGTNNTLVVTEADYNLAAYGSAISYDGGATWTRIINYNFGGDQWDPLPYNTNDTDPDNDIEYMQHLAVAFRDINFGLSGHFSHLHDPNDANDGWPSDGIYIFHEDISGIADQTIEGLNVFPNPANYFVKVSAENAALQNIVIFDITGKEVINLNLSENNANINVSGLDNGIYLMKITDADNNHQAVKLVIK